MKKKIFIIIVIIIFITVGYSLLISSKKEEVKEVRTFVNPVLEISPSPSPPQTFKYDSSTDLEKELESIDPKVLDSDLNE